MGIFRDKRNRQEKLILRRKNMPQFKNRRPDNSFTLSKFVHLVLWILFLAVLVYVFLFSQFLQVRHFGLGGVSELPYEKVLDEIKSFCEGNFFGFVPKNNLLLISENKLKSDLLREFRKIKSVEIKKKFPDSLEVRIEERKSLILWCSGGPCYIVDEKGYAYTGIGLDDPAVKENNLIQLVDTSARPVKIGEKILTGEYVSFLLELREEIKNGTDIEISEEWHTPSLVAEEVELKTTEGRDIYFSGKIPAEKAIRTLKAFLEEQIQQDERKNLEYIDLRTENKVYYKMKKVEEDKDRETEELKN